MTVGVSTENECAAPVGKLRDQANEAGESELAKSWSMKAQEFEEEANVINDAIVRLDGPE